MHGRHARAIVIERGLERLWHRVPRCQSGTGNHDCGVEFFIVTDYSEMQISKKKISYDLSYLGYIRRFVNKLKMLRSCAQCDDVIRIVSNQDGAVVGIDRRVCPG